jgi:hypothetical protein
LLAAPAPPPLPAEVAAQARLVALAAEAPEAEALAALAAHPDLLPGPRARAGQALLARKRLREARDALLMALAAAEPPPEAARWELQAALWQAPGPLPSPLPAPLAEEVARFGQGMRALLCGAPPEAEGPPPGRLTPHALALLWLTESCEMLDAGALGPEARAALAARTGLSPAFLDLAAQGAEAVGEACFRDWPELPFAGDAAIPLRMRDVAATLRLGAKPSLCPFTGERRLLRDNLAPDIFLHRAGPAPCLVMAAAHWVHALQDAAWLFPDARLLLLAARPERAFAGPEAALRQMAEALAQAWIRADSLRAYLADGERRVAVAPLVTAHVGHDLWNNLSGWARLFSLVGPEAPDHIVSLARGRIYPDLPALYPEHAAAIAGRRLEAADEKELAALLHDRRLLLVTVRDQFISGDLARRILRAARRACAPAFLGRLSALRAEAPLMLLVTLRLGNRAWVEQEEGLVALLRALGEEFPGLAVVLDGMNAGAERGSTHGLMSLEAEAALAARIEAGLAGALRVENAVGAPMAESLALCAAADAFLAPIGAGMAKCRWIANKPGLAYSNPMMLRPESYDGRLYDNPRFREAPRRAVFLAPGQVREVEAQRHGQAFRANFSMDWRALHAPARALLARIAARKAEAGSTGA